MIVNRRTFVVKGEHMDVILAEIQAEVKRTHSAPSLYVAEKEHSTQLQWKGR